MARTVIEKIINRLTHQGVLATLHLINKNIVHQVKAWLDPEILHIDREFDKTHGTDTSRMVELRQLSIRSENIDQGVRYQTTDQTLFHRIMHDLDIDYKDFIFIDFGSGKGKVLLLASNYPFKKIIGIEFSPELHAISQKNIALYKPSSQTCHALETVCMDVTRYPIPPVPAVYYFFHPFGESVLGKVLENIRKSLEETNRKILIIYVNPELSTLLENSGFLKTVAVEKMYRIYESREF